jgi:hypothetical protein
MPPQTPQGRLYYLDLLSISQSIMMNHHTSAPELILSMDEQYPHHLELSRNAHSWALSMSCWIKVPKIRALDLCFNKPSRDSDACSSLKTAWGRRVHPELKETLGLKEVQPKEPQFFELPHSIFQQGQSRFIVRSCLKKTKTKSTKQQQQRHQGTLEYV